MRVRAAAQRWALGRLKNCRTEIPTIERNRTTAFETEEQKREIQRWSRLAVQLIGAADSRSFDHITTADMVRELQGHDVFARLTRELPATVWEISKLTDVDRHKLSRHWRMLAEAYEPKQFHVRRSGLALLAAYVLHLIDVSHATIPK